MIIALKRMRYELWYQKLSLLISFNTFNIFTIHIVLSSEAQEIVEKVATKIEICNETTKKQR